MDEDSKKESKNERGRRKAGKKRGRMESLGEKRL